MKTKHLILAFLTGTALVGAAHAADDSALMQLLLKKGVINEQEAKTLRAEMTKEDQKALVSTTQGKYVEKVTLKGRVQSQWFNLTTDIDGTPAGPAATSHFFMRRVYFGFKAELKNNWSTSVVYDFAGALFDEAFLQWKPSKAFVLELGLRKAPISYEEYFTSSGAIKPIERAAVTRYFAEPNNGRRLGAGSYFQGIYVLGEKGGFNYQVAVTNPERSSNAAEAAGTGGKGNNNVALWGHLGYKDKFDAGQGSYKAGICAGLLPDQGGKVTGTGSDLSVGSAFLDVTRGNLNLLGEYFWSHVERGASATADANPNGYFLQASYTLGKFEPVARYSYVDTDGRGIDLSDGVRSAPVGGTMNTMFEWFAGANWYVNGNDLKLQLGYVHGESKNTVTGGRAKATTDGVRSLIQLQF